MNAVLTHGAVEDVLSRLKRQLEKAHITLLRNPETRLYSGVIMLGESTIVVDIPTACTDGRNKFYGRDFMAELTQPEIVGVVMHECMHVALKHLYRYPDMIKEDPQLANASMDYIVNGLIHKLAGYGVWIVLPKCALHDTKFDGWSVREVYNFLKKGQDKDGQQQERKERYECNDDAADKQPQPKPDKSDKADKPEPSDDEEGGGESDEGTGESPKPTRTHVNVGGKDYNVMPMDEHDHNALAEADQEQIEQHAKDVDEAIQQAGIMAGVLGLDVPQAIKQAMAPVVDWREVVAEFVSSTAQGRDEYTWRRLNRRRLVDDVFMPDVESETLNEMLVCIDASGSTIGPVLDMFCETLSVAAKSIMPDRIRVLSWDTEVRNEQVFEGDYDNLRERLHIVGGGGTRVGCVSSYMLRNGIRPDCVLVLTDGYVEDNPVWDTTAPTLWVVTENARFVPPAGRIVNTKS